MKPPLSERPTDIVGLSDIAERLGVSPQTVNSWALRNPYFPAPFVTLAMGRIFDYREVLEFSRKRGLPRARTEA